MSHKESEKMTEEMIIEEERIVQETAEEIVEPKPEAVQNVAPKGSHFAVKEPSPFPKDDFPRPAPIWWKDAISWGKRNVEGFGELGEDEPLELLDIINEARVRHGLPEFLVTDFIAEFGYEPRRAA